MCWRRTSLSLLLLSLAGASVAGEGHVVGAGLEGDSSDGLAISLLADYGLADETWLSAAIARNSGESAFRQDLDTWYADVGIDHWWDPIGLRAGVAYWGDNDTLDSTDWRASVYWRNEKLSISADYEYRDFSILFPETDRFPSRDVGFSADGVGVSARFNISDSVSVGVSGLDYDYDVNLQLDSNRPLLLLLSYSRLSLINSLVDYRVAANLGVDVGERRWQLDLGAWRGEVDGSTTRSATVRFLTPMSDRSDVEFALGIDDSALYGNVTFFSVFLFFYGGA